ncbi:MAG: signal peptide peptidase SppA [Faecalicoccus sp.]|nr:signal peptide peptidase SppA [Faecalicoccus sp.]
MGWLLNILGNLISIAIAIGIIVLIGFALFSKRKKKDDIEMDKVDRVVLDVNLVDEKKNDFGLSKAMTMEDLKKALTVLEKDKKIKELALDMDSFDCSLAQMVELDPYLERIKKNKKVTAYATSLEMQDYLCAVAADSIYVLDSNSSRISLEAPSSSTMYYKRILDKLGIRMHVIHVGAYKGTGENYSLDKMSPERRESIHELQEQTLSAMMERIQKYRHIDIKEDLLSGKWYYTGRKEALSAGLIDGFAAYMDMPRNNENKTVSINRYFSEKYKEKEKKKQDEILVFPLSGTIREKDGLNDAGLLSQIRQIKDHENAKGIVLYINSPGGSALESEKMYQRLKALDLPVYAFQSEVAASGGYYICSAAKKIYATPFTITGSIGVVSMIPNVSGAIKKLDITVENENTGNYESFDPTLPLSKEVEDKIRASMLETYAEFKERVKSARGMDEDTLEPLAGGRVYLGCKAKEIGLIDEVGTLEDCIKALAKELNLTSYAVKTIYKKQDLQDRFPLPLDKLNTEAMRILSQDAGIQMLEPEYQSIF